MRDGELDVKVMCPPLSFRWLAHESFISREDRTFSAALQTSTPILWQLGHINIPQESLYLVVRALFTNGAGLQGQQSLGKP